MTIDNHYDDAAVACSFGKDSVVILHMALQVNPDINVIFQNTGVEFPETIKYKNMLTDLWNLNLTETKPSKGMTFWKCADKYGLPHIRDGKNRRAPKCCHYLKKKPMKIAINELDAKAIFTGMTAAESRARWMLALRYDQSDDERFCSQVYYAKTWNSWQVHPIIAWTSSDVWSYIKRHGIPINPVYTKWNGIYNRCGCLPCTAYSSWEKKLSISHPKLYCMLKSMKCREVVS